MKQNKWFCYECHRVNDDKYNMCFNCGKPRSDIDHLRREYSKLTGREKEIIKTFIINTLTDFRSKNLDLIQRNFQLETQDGLREIWNSVAAYVIR